MDRRPDGRWRLRWRTRESVEEPWCSREKIVDGPQVEVEALALHIRRLRALTDNRGPLPADVGLHVEAAPAARPPANLLAGFNAFLEARAAQGRFRPKTVASYTTHKVRLAEHLHEIAKIPTSERLPVTLLHRDTFAEILRRDEVAGISQGTRYASLRLLLDVWRWMADDPERWPAVPRPPHSTRDYLPTTAKWGRTVAPSLAHVDAMLRRLPDRTSTTTRMVGVFLRCTGLRVGTVMGLRREDFDLEARTLHIRGDADKSDYDRIVPLSAVLLAEVRPFVELTSSGFIFHKRRFPTARHDEARKPPRVTFTTAWEAATKAGEVPRHVWAPPNRKIARPDHALRAAFDAHLIDAGVPSGVVDYLVGRNEADIRDRHYGRDLLEQARAAVDQIPSVDWHGPHRADNVVSFAG